MKNKKMRKQRICAVFLAVVMMAGTLPPAMSVVSYGTVTGGTQGTFEGSAASIGDGGVVTDTDQKGSGSTSEAAGPAGPGEDPGAGDQAGGGAETENGGHGSQPSGTQGSGEATEDQTGTEQEPGTGQETEQGTEPGTGQGTQLEQGTGQSAEGDLPASVMKELGLSLEGAMLEGAVTESTAKLERITATNGTMYWSDTNPRGELTLAAEQEKFSLNCVLSGISDAQTAPTVTIDGVPVVLNQPQGEYTLKPGETKKLTVVSTAKNGTASETYYIYAHRTTAYVKMTASAPEWRANGKRVFYLDVAVSPSTIRTFMTALKFDPNKLALADRDTGEASKEYGKVVGSLDLDFYDPKDKYSPFKCFTTDSRYLDNEKGFVQLHLAQNTDGDPPYTFEKETGILRLCFQIKDEHLAFDENTLKLSVNQEQITPKAGISLLEDLGAVTNTEIGLSRFTTGNPEMVTFYGLEELYQEGDLILPETGYTVDLTSPYLGDVLLLTNAPFKEDGSKGMGGNFRDWNASLGEKSDTMTMKNGAFSLKENKESEDSGTTFSAFSAPELSTAEPFSAEEPFSETEPFSAPEPLTTLINDETVIDGQSVEVLDFRPSFSEPRLERDLSVSASGEGAGTAVGSTRSFQTLKLQSNSSYEYEQTTFELAETSSHINLWIDPADETIQHLTQEKRKEMIDEFEESYGYLTREFGPLHDKDGNGKLDVLLYDIKDRFGAGSHQYYQGVFNINELFFPKGNDMDLLHLDTYPTMGEKTNPQIDSVLSTMVHEGQHLAFYSALLEVKDEITNNQDLERYAPTWINEGLSLSAEHGRYGALSSRIHRFNTSPTIKNGTASLTVWSNDNTDNYALSYLFFEYLRTQAESAGLESHRKGFYTDYSKNQKLALESLIREIPQFEGNDLDQILQTFYLALYINEGNSVYGFHGDAQFDNVCPQVMETLPEHGMVNPGSGVYYGLSTRNGTYMPSENPIYTSKTVKFAGITNPEVELTLQVTAGAGGGVSVSPREPVYERGTAVTLTAEAEPGYRFKGWSGNATGSDTTLELYMNKPKTVRAEFEKIAPLHLEILCDSAEGGDVSVSQEPNHPTEAGCYEPGTQVTLTAQPAAQYSFIGWREAGTFVSYEKEYMTTLKENRQITACFQLLIPLNEEEVKEIFPQLRQIESAGGGAMITEAGALELPLTKGTMEIALANGTPIRALTDLSKEAVVKIGAKEKDHYRFRGYVVTKKGAETLHGVPKESGGTDGLRMQSNASNATIQSNTSNATMQSNTSNATMQSNASNATRMQTNALNETVSSGTGSLLTGGVMIDGNLIELSNSYEQGSIGDISASMELLGSLAEGETVLIKDPQIWMPLTDYAVSALFGEEQGDVTLESVALSALSVKLPEGRRLVRRSGEGFSNTDPRYGYTGGVTEYDLYLLSHETGFTLTPTILAEEAVKAAFTWEGTRKEVLYSGEEFSFDASGAGFDGKTLILDVSYTDLDGLVTMRQFSIHVHKMQAASQEPLVKAEVKTESAQPGVTGGAKITAKLQNTNLGAARFTLDFSNGVKLTDRNGVAIQPSDSLTGSSGAAAYEKLGAYGMLSDSLEVVSMKYQEISPESAGLQADSGPVYRLSVTVAPMAEQTEGLFLSLSDMAEFYVSGYDANKELSGQIAVSKAVMPSGEAELTADANSGLLQLTEENYNVIGDLRMGVLWNRTSVYSGDYERVSVTGRVSSYDPKKGLRIEMKNQARPEYSVEAEFQGENSGSGEQVQEFEIKVAPGDDYTVVLQKAGSLPTEIRNVPVGEAGLDLTALLKTLVSEDAALPGADFITESGAVRLLPGDVDGDGTIGLLDRTHLTGLGWYGKTLAELREQAQGAGAADTAGLKDPSGILFTNYDLNGDGILDLGDVTLLTSTQYYGKETSVITLHTGPAVEVPTSKQFGSGQTAEVLIAEQFGRGQTAPASGVRTE